MEDDHTQDVRRPHLKWKTTSSKMEDNLTQIGRRPKRKTTNKEDDQKRRRPKTKTTKKRRRPKTKMTKNEDDQK